jgi:glycosyltransferase involved in cell wall biosynthesis
MRVVILGSKGYPSVAGAGGVEHGVMHVAEELSNAGHDVIVYERGPRGKRREGRVTIRSVPFVNRRTLASWSHLLLSLLDAGRHLRAVDVYHVHCAQNGFACLPLRFTGARVLFHIHGCEWRAKKWGLLMSLAIRLSCVVGAIAAHSVVVVCERSSRFLAGTPRVGRKIRLIANGIPSHLIALDVSRPQLRLDLLFVGRLVPQKRLDLLLQAMRDLPPELTLTVIGPTSHCDAYAQSLVASAANDPRVRFLGQCDRDTVAGFYARCFAVVLPSDHEGCSNVLLEALAAGCCIVASDIPENRAVTGDAAALFAAGDGEALCSTLLQLLANRSEAARLRMAARARATALPRWEAVAGALAAEYLGEREPSTA